MDWRVVVGVASSLHCDFGINKFMLVQPVHVITSAAFHPSNGDLLAYSTSKTVLSVMDLRQKDFRGDQAITFHQPAPVRDSLSDSPVITRFIF